MSVRAYKLIKIETAERPTFNLWHDDEVVELLDINSKSGLSDGSGIIMIEKNEVENALKEAEGEDTKEILKQMLQDLGDDDAVDYYCF